MRTASPGRRRALGLGRLSLTDAFVSSSTVAVTQQDTSHRSSSGAGLRALLEIGCSSDQGAALRWESSGAGVRKGAGSCRSRCPRHVAWLPSWPGRKHAWPGSSHSCGPDEGRTVTRDTRKAQEYPMHTRNHRCGQKADAGLALSLVSSASGQLLAAGEGKRCLGHWAPTCWRGAGPRRVLWGGRCAALYNAYVIRAL